MSKIKDKVKEIFGKIKEAFIKLKEIIRNIITKIKEKMFKKKLSDFDDFDELDFDLDWDAEDDFFFNENANFIFIREEYAGDKNIKHIETTLEKMINSKKGICFFDIDDFIDINKLKSNITQLKSVLLIKEDKEGSKEEFDKILKSIFKLDYDFVKPHNLESQNHIADYRKIIKSSIDKKYLGKSIKYRDFANVVDKAYSNNNNALIVIEDMCDKCIAAISYASSNIDDIVICKNALYILTSINALLNEIRILLNQSISSQIIIKNYIEFSER